MAGESTIEITDSNFESEVIQADVPVLVDFWAEWCPPCKMLLPTINEIAGEYAGKAKIGKVDTDANREISMNYGIQSIPTMIIFKNGEETKRLVGLTNKDEIAAALDAAIG